MDNGNNNKLRLWDFISEGLIKVRPDMSDIDKAFVLTRYIDSFSYSTNYLSKGSDEAIKNEKAVFQHYAFLGSLLMKAAGLNVMLNRNLVRDHVYIWIKIKLANGNKAKWYIIDPTFIDGGEVNAKAESSKAYQTKTGQNGYHWQWFLAKAANGNWNNDNNDRHFSGHAIWGELPIDFLYDNDEISYDNFCD